MVAASPVLPKRFQLPGPPNRKRDASEIVTCCVDEGMPTACGRQVGSGGSKSERLCSRHYAAKRRHPDRPLVGQPKKVAGRVGTRISGVIPPDMLALAEALRGGRSRSAWIAEAIQEKASRETGCRTKTKRQTQPSHPAGSPAGVRVASVVHQAALATVERLRGGRSRSAWIAEAIQEKASRETG